MTASLRRWVAASALAAAAASPAHSAGGDDPGASPSAIHLTMRDAIVVALRHNRILANARLGRSVERFALRIAEDEFRPQVGVNAFADRDAWDVVDETAGVGASIRLKVPTGREFEISS